MFICLLFIEQEIKMSTSVFPETQTLFCFSYADAELRSDIK